MGKSSFKTFIILTISVLCLLLFVLSGYQKEKIYLLKTTIIVSLASIILYSPAGIALLSRTLENVDINLYELILLSIPYGMAIHIIFFYILSIAGEGIINIYTIFLVSLIPLALVKKDKIKPKKCINTFLIASVILAFTLNLIILFYPTGKLISLRAYKYSLIYPSGDDPKNHIEIIKSILRTRTIARRYYNYPSHRILYPEGFHLIISEISLITKIDPIKLFVPFATFSIIILVSSLLLLINKYPKCVVFGILLMTLSDVLVLKLLAFGRYPQLMGYSLMPFFVFIVKRIHKKKRVILISILLSLLGYISPYAFLPGLLMIVFEYLLQKSIKISELTKVILLVTLLLSPMILLNGIFTTIRDDLDFVHEMGLDEYKPTIYDFILFPLYQLITILKTRAIESLIIFAENVDYITQFITVLMTSIIAILSYPSKIEREIKLWLSSILVTSILSYYIGSYISIFYLIRPDLILLSIYTPAIIIIAQLFSQLAHNNCRKFIFFVFLFLIITLPIKIIRSDSLEYKSLTEGDIEFLKAINKTIKNRNSTVIFNDFFRGTSTTLITPYLDIKVTSPFLSPENYQEILTGNTLVKQIMVRTIPDYQESVNYFNKSGSKYIVFSTYFKSAFEKMNYTLPQWKPEKFIRPCFRKLYGKNYNYLYEISYEKCDGKNYFVILSKKYETNDSLSPTHKMISFKTRLKLKIPENNELLETYLLINFSSTGIGNMSVVYTTNNRTKDAYVKFFNKENDLILPLQLNTVDLIKNGSLEIQVSGSNFTINSINVLVRLKEYPELRNYSVSLIGCKVENNTCKIYPGRAGIILAAGNYTSNMGLSICYNDTKGNVDINMYNPSTGWRPIQIISRKQTNSYTCTVIRNIPPCNLVGIYLVPHVQELEIYGVFPTK